MRIALCVWTCVVVHPDNLTLPSYSKIGYAGNMQPQCIIPSCIAVKEYGKVGNRDTRRLGTGLDDLNFYIGDEAIAAEGKNDFSLKWPIRHGIIEDWDLMQRYMEQVIFGVLRAEPEDHFFLMTEPPLNTPENREYLAEIMFETFNIPGLYIAMQAMLALVASWGARKAEERSLTGTVIDSGDGVTHVMPVVDGYVVGSCIKHIPIAGRDITSFIQQLLRERESGIPPDLSMEVAKKIKERYCYICSDIAREFRKYDLDPQRWLSTKDVVEHPKHPPVTFDVGYERFLAPAVFFHPEFVSRDYTESISTVVDGVIQNSPIDARRGLYANIVLSGGSSMFKNLGRRIQRDIQSIVNTRLEMTEKLTGGRMKPTPIEVNVVSHRMQRYAVWLGGSILASTPEFYTACHTRAQYEEYGPAICRHNPMFASLT